MSKNNKIRKKQDLPTIQQKEGKSKTMSPPPFALDSSGPMQKKDNASGNSLPQNVQNKMESTMGADFSNVKVHANSGKAEQMGALAYAQGNEVHFAQGQYDPHSQKGQELIGHELAHVKQQAEGKVQAKGEVAGQPLNEDAHLEREADELGSKAAKGDAAAAPKQLKKVDNAKGKPMQRFKMRSKDMAQYPKFAQFVKEEMPAAINDPRLVHFLNLFGTNQGDTARNIQSDLQWGQGPEVQPYNMSASAVSFRSGKDSEIIRLSRKLVQNYEKNDTFQQSMHKMVLESNILNGYTQFLDDQDGKDLWGKEGVMTEKAQFGLDINTSHDAREARRCHFGKGTWEVTVLSASGSKGQRFRIYNATDGNGLFDAKPGTKVEVKHSDFPKWLIRTEYNLVGQEELKNWKKSETLTTKEGKDTYLVRAEEDGNKDNQDLQLRVKRKGD